MDLQFSDFPCQLRYQSTTNLINSNRYSPPKETSTFIMKESLLDAWDAKCIMNSHHSCLQGVYFLVLVKSLNNNALHAKAIK